MIGRLDRKHNTKIKIFLKQLLLIVRIRSDQIIRECCVILHLLSPFIIEEHSRLIQQKYNQLVSNLSCLGDIIAAMYQNEKLTPKESEQIQHLQSTPIRASEELLS